MMRNRSGRLDHLKTDGRVAVRHRRHAGSGPLTGTVTDPIADILVSDRPWGQFTRFACNTPVTVKIITVEPGQRLSLQRHELRGELWHILDVPIDVTIGTFERLATPGETVWIRQGMVHRLRNCGETAGRVLEVAFGTFDEDDIERLEDDYHR